MAVGPREQEEGNIHLSQLEPSNKHTADLEASRSGVQQIQGLMEALFLVQDGCLLTVSSHGGRV